MTAWGSMGAQVYGVCGVTVLICLANTAILVTLPKTKSFKTPIKFHLALIAVFESCASLFLCLRIVFDSLYGLSIVACRVILGCVGFAATGLICTNISMSYECLVMLNSQYSSGSVKSFSKRGIAILIISAICLGLSAIWFNTASGNHPGHCMVIHPAIYSPVGLKVFVIHTFILVLTNVIIIIIVAWKLYLFHRNRRPVLQVNVLPMRNTNKNMEDFKTMRYDRLQGTSTSNRLSVRVVDKDSAILTQFDSNKHSVMQISRRHAPLKERNAIRFRSRTRPITELPLNHTDAAQKLDLNQSEGTVENNRFNKERSMPNIDEYTSTRNSELDMNISKLMKSAATSGRWCDGKLRLGQEAPVAAGSRESRRRRHGHVALMLLAAGVFMLCYTPYCLTTSLYVFCAQHCGVDAATIKASATLSIAHALFSVLLYVIKDKHFRRALCRATRRRVHVGSFRH